MLLLLEEKTKKFRVSSEGGEVGVFVAALFKGAAKILKDAESHSISDNWSEYILRSSEALLAPTLGALTPDREGYYSLSGGTGSYYTDKCKVRVFRNGKFAEIGISGESNEALADKEIMEIVPTLVSANKNAPVDFVEEAYRFRIRDSPTRIEDLSRVFSVVQNALMGSSRALEGERRETISPDNEFYAKNFAFNKKGGWKVRLSKNGGKMEIIVRANEDTCFDEHDAMVVRKHVAEAKEALEKAFRSDTRFRRISR